MRSGNEHILTVNIEIVWLKIIERRFERLKSEVETLVGRKIASPKDFAFLMRQIHGYTQETISVSTLKRMWGYVNSNTKHSKFNLDLLSRMVGYAGWDALCRDRIL